MLQLCADSHICKSYLMRWGALRAGWVMLAFVPAMVVVPFYCYHMAVSHHQEKPFPAATVTSTACHYSQDISFRFIMLAGSSFLALNFYIFFKWLLRQAKKYEYPEPVPTYLYPIAEFSVLLFCITIGTIDERGTGKWHGPCAVVFFLVLIVSIVQVTLFLTSLKKWNSSSISSGSLRVKQVIAVYLVVVWIYCIAGLIAVSEGDFYSKKGDKYVVIVEWNTVTAGLLWMLAWMPEYHPLYITLKDQTELICGLTVCQNQSEGLCS